MAEIQALAYQRLASVNLLICRPCPTYGRDGETAAATAGHAVSEAVHRALVGSTGDIELALPTMELVYVKDVAFALREALFVEKPASRVYNVGSGELVSATDVAAAIAAAVPGARVTAQAIPAGPARLLETTAAHRDLGYEPRWPLARGIADLAADLQKLG